MMTRYTLLASAVSAAALLTACGGAKNAPETEKADLTTPTERVEASLNGTISVTDVVEDEASAPAQPGDEDEEDVSPVSDVTDDELEDDTPVPASLETADASEAEAADGAAKMMIVMDASGSMWGQIDGTAKMSIARDALRDMVEDIPMGTQLGLIAYGHRKKGDCKDIETLINPSVRNNAAITAAVDVLTPKGKTPLSAAVQQAADTLKIEENRSTVVLITDGIETCDADPCALGTSLEESGVDFTAHVIGFGLSEQEGRQIACLAENTGGRYIEASNAGELTDALETVADTVEETPEPEPELAEATLTVPETVEIGSAFEVTWTGPENEDRNDYIDLAENERGTKPGGHLSWGYIHDKEVVELRAPAEVGTYTVRYGWVNPPHTPKILVTETIEVVDADVVLISPATVGIGEEFEVEWRGPGNSGDYVDLVPEDQTVTTKQISYGYANDDEGIAKLTAPANPAKLNVRYIAKGAGGERVMKSVPITVEEVRAEVAFNPVATLGEELEVSWTGPGSPGDYIDIVERGFEKTNTQLSYRYANKTNPVDLRLPGDPGEYDVRYILKASDGERVLARAPLTLGGSDVSLSFEPEAATGHVLEVDWVGPGSSGDYIDIVERGFTKTNTQLSYRYASKTNPVELNLPGTPGEYDVRYILKSSNGERIMVTEPLTVTATEVSLTHPEKISLGDVLEVEWSGPPPGGHYIDIVPEGYRKTSGEISYAYTGKDPYVEIKLPAEPGDYEVRFILKAADAEYVVERSALTIEDIDTGLQAASKAEAGEKIEVSWKGPGGQNDYIDIVERGKRIPKNELEYTYTRQGNPLELKMPDEPGDYDIRYVHRGAKEKIIKAVIEIEVE